MLDRSEADETVEFGLDGVTYEIDLSEQNATSLRDVLDDYVQHARRQGGRRRRSGRSTNGRGSGRGGEHDRPVG